MRQFLSIGSRAGREDLELALVRRQGELDLGFKFLKIAKNVILASLDVGKHFHGGKVHNHSVEVSDAWCTPPYRHRAKRGIPCQMNNPVAQAA